MAARQRTNLEQEKYLKQLTLSSDACFRVSLKLCSPEELENYLQLLADTITGRKTGLFHDVQSQKDLITVTGAKSNRPDLFGYDHLDGSWSVEMQNDSIESGRIEAQTAHMVLNALPEGKPYSSMKKSHMIWMTDAVKLAGLNGALFEGNTAVVRLETVISKTRRRIRSNTEVILFNLRYVAGNARGQLAHDFRQSDPEKIIHPFLRMLMRRIKYTKKGRAAMCKITRQIYNDGLREGRAEGRKEGHKAGLEERSVETARSLLKMGMLTLQQIAWATKLPVKEVRRLQAQMEV